MSECPKCTDKQSGIGVSDCPYLNSAYVFAGLAMMLNIRLSYSSAPYALIRFRLPENLFSVFVRRMASALELWCLPSMLLGNIVEYSLKGYYKHHGYTQDWDNGNGNLKDVKSKISIQGTGDSGTEKTYTIKVKNIPHINDTFTPRKIKFWVIIIPSIISQWLNFLTYVILFVVYVAGGDRGHLTLFYLVIAISGFVFGINMVLLYAVDWNYIPVYMVGENSFPIVTSFMHYISTLIFGNRRKWNSDFLIVYIDIWVAIVISFVAAVLWTLGYGIYRDTKTNVITYPKGNGTVAVTIGTPGDDGKCKAAEGTLTITGITNGTTKGAGAKDLDGPTLTLNLKATDTTGKAAPLVTLEDTEGSVNANVEVDTNNNKLTVKYTQGDYGNKKCIEIEIKGITKQSAAVHYGHIFTDSFDTTAPHWQIISPTLMVIVGMGLVYAIYPGIAPGMIVPFYLIDKIEMVLLIATFFPPIIVATLQKVKPEYSPKTKFASPSEGMGGWKYYEYTDWSGSAQTAANASFYHAFDILLVIKISLAAIFIYSLHYRDSSLSRSIVNQPKMSTALSIIFYMCHECLLALGFPGIIGNNGSTYVMLPAQYVGALFMIFLAFYSEGYIIEYKSHDPAHWPTEGIFYLYGYYQLNPDFFIMIKFNVCSDG
uniref:Theileria-specific sub-telomeric protein, putative n=1 Tax=Theileria annulata TaxID=5874 RepID=A0A3B0MXY5_THEAN